MAGALTGTSHADATGAVLGLADPREFGLTWEDCDGYLSRLGYRTKGDVVQAS